MKNYSHLPCGSTTIADFSCIGSKISSEVCVDKTRFKPSLVRNDFGQRVDGSVSSPQYHFLNGVDNGMPLSAINRIGSDITEIEHDSRVLESRLDSQINKVNEDLKNEVDNLKKVIEDTSKSSVKQNSNPQSSSEV